MYMYIPKQQTCTLYIYMYMSKCPLCIYIFIYSCMVGTEGWVGMDCLSFLFFSFLIPFYYWCAIHVYFHVYTYVY